MNNYYLNGKNLGGTKRFYFLILLLFGQFIYAQAQTTITGTVNESAGSSPLPGVNVLEKGTSNGTITDFDGNFSLEVSDPDATLVMSFVGYQTQELALNGQTSITVQMEEDAQALEEVVLIGYGSVKKKDLTGAVGSLDETTITERNVTSPLEAMQGNVPGVVISNSSGRVGDEFNITVRGKNSIGGNNNPLYVVDGVITDGIDFLNPNEISKIDILKDAASTAIYGSRGSNGVIIVSTKSGATARSQTTVSFDSFFGVKTVARLPQMMDIGEWFDYHQTAYLATISDDPMSITPEQLESTVIGSNNSLLRERVNNNETFDWYDAVLKDGFQSNNYINVSGRAESGVAYNIGVGYQTETGTLENESLDKYSFKSSIETPIGKKVRVGSSFSIAKSDIERGSQVGMREAFRLSPGMTPYGIDGELYPQPGKLRDENGDYLINKTSTYNPLLEIMNSTDETKRLNLFGNLFFEYKPVDWITFKSTFSSGYDKVKRGRAWGAMTNTGISNNNLPSADLENFENFNYNWDNQVNLTHTINDNHNFNLLLLQSIWSSTTETSELSSRNQPFDVSYHNLGSGEQSTFNLGSNYIKQTLSSFALRLNYDYKGKFLVTLSNRWDGSSLLSEGNKWDSFPSIAGAWRISQEDFLADSDFVYDLKLRASYGYTGNNVIDPYSTQNLLDLQTYYDLNGTTANGWLPSALANSSLGWEKTREFNVGIDFGFFNGRLGGSIDFYDKLSDDLLFDQKLPTESGWPEITANLGSVANTGVEIGLNGTIIENENLRWEASLTYAQNNNSIEEIYGDGADDIGNGLFIGESIDAIYNFKYTGVWQADERDLAASYGQSEGQGKVLDVNNDGAITGADRIILGSTDPDWSGGFFTKLSFFNFDLSTSMITNQGVFVLSRFHDNFADTRDRGRQKMAGLDYYVPENGAGLPANFTNAYPQGRNQGTYVRNNNVAYYKDASFVKVKNIAFGYTFGDHILDKIKLSYFRVYANILDPFVFTDYEGYDPEWAGASLNIGRVGSITYQLGVSLKF